MSSDCCEYPEHGAAGAIGCMCGNCCQFMPLNVVNLTPHAITVRVGDVDATFPASGVVARVSQNPARDAGRLLLACDGGEALVPLVTAPSFGAVEGLPPYDRGTVLLVSGLVLSHVSGMDRPDVFAPATGPADGAIRDEGGRIIAVTRLVAAGGGA